MRLRGKPVELLLIGCVESMLRVKENAQRGNQTFMFTELVAVFPLYCLVNFGRLKIERRIDNEPKFIFDEPSEVGVITF